MTLDLWRYAVVIISGIPAVSFSFGVVQMLHLFCSSNEFLHGFLRFSWDGSLVARNSCCEYSGIWNLKISFETNCIDVDKILVNLMRFVTRSVNVPWDEELKDFLQWRMAPWIPSCCSSKESSLRRIDGGATPIAADADRLFPKFFVTILKLPTLLLSENFLGDKLTGAVTGEDDGVEESVDFALLEALL